jgi:2-polyprenyl-3-methyl-5-hydroxy-6-metoxy-1,4-benzoquinol methylase
MISHRRHIFDRSGIAALSDLQTQEWAELFTSLEREQSVFLEQEGRFRSPEYKWPRDPLHNWSRVWEYPYVYHHLKCWCDKPERQDALRVLDLGSGVTFFPFSVARLGYQVLCSDIDRVCESDLHNAALCVPHEPGTVEFRLATGTTLSFSDGEVDIIYCISVLEHIPAFENTISEMARVLKPGGLLLLTIDIDLRGDLELGIEAYKRLVLKLQEEFDYLFPEHTIHPADMLHSAIGPYSVKGPRGIELARHVLKQRIAKPLLGKRPRGLAPFYLTVQGFVMIKT